MLFIVLGNAVVYLLSTFAQNSALYNLLCFNRTAILQGQIWRLFTYPLTYQISSPILMLISLYCYYSIGRVMEYYWGTLRFNLFYISGVVMMDLYCLAFGGQASVTYLNLSLFLSYATIHPDARFLLFFIIPVKAWLFAIVDLVIVLIDLVTLPFPYNFFSVISIANYFLFFGKDVLNLIPRNWRLKASRSGKTRKTQQAPKVIPFDASRTRSPKTETAANYTHRCTVCGRTDVSNPELEFRYCSRCKGYYCYCQEHIGNHSHIQ